MKKQVDRRRKEVEEWKKSDKIILSIKDLVVMNLDSRVRAKKQPYIR